MDLFSTATGLLGGGSTSGLTGGGEGPSSAAATAGDYNAGSLNMGQDSILKYAVIGGILLIAYALYIRGNKK